MDTIQLPEGVEVVNPNPESDGIRLPFNAPVLWWVNGEKNLKEIGGVKYFGGWNGSDTEIEAAVSEYGALPDGFTLETTQGRDGEYAVYSKRNLTVVPVKTRKRWVDGRSHSQTLVLIGQKNSDGGFDVWGPALLSVKGYMTQRLSGAFDDWQRATTKARQEIAPSVPAWYFWCAVGTFGEREEEMVGGGNKRSPITPVKAFLPDVTTDMLKKLYVGGDIAAKIAEYAELAHEWATDKRWIKNIKEENDTQMTNEELRAEFGWQNEPIDEDPPF